MEEISSRSSYLRMKESLADSGKVLLIDKNGSYTRKESFAIYSGIINELNPFINTGDVCLIAPFNRKETVLLDFECFADSDWHLDYEHALIFTEQLGSAIGAL